MFKKEHIFIIISGDDDDDDAGDDDNEGWSSGIKEACHAVWGRREQQQEKHLLEPRAYQKYLWSIYGPSLWYFRV